MYELVWRFAAPLSYFAFLNQAGTRCGPALNGVYAGSVAAVTATNAANVSDCICAFIYVVKLLL